MNIRTDEQIDNLENRLSHLKKLSESTQIDQNYLRKSEVDTNHNIITYEKKFKDECELILQENSKIFDQNIQKEKINLISDELLKKGREEVQKIHLEFKIHYEEVTQSMHDD